MRNKLARQNFYEFCVEYLSEIANGASTIALKQAYIDAHPNRVMHLAGSTVGLSIWIRSDEQKRFIQLNKLWYLKEGLHETKLSE